VAFAMLFFSSGILIWGILVLGNCKCSVFLLNDLIHLGLVLGLAACARGVHHHAGGLGLAHALASVGLDGLGR
jgi:hypothetical protein